MSWAQWPAGTVAQAGVVQAPIINPAPNVVNPAATTMMSTNQYTPEQWAQMQQQNWQQWAQWQQQFQQWQQQYGAEYQKSMALAQSGATPVQPPVPFFSMGASAPPPLPTETKPPPPPDDPQVPQYQPPSTASYSSFPAAPLPTPQINFSTAPPPPQPQSQSQPQPPKDHFQSKFNPHQGSTPLNQGGFPNHGRSEGYGGDNQRYGGNQSYAGNSNNRGHGRSASWQNQNSRHQQKFGDRFQPVGPPTEPENRSEGGMKRTFSQAGDGGGDLKRNKLDPNPENSRWQPQSSQQPKWEPPPNPTENQQWNTKPADTVAKPNPEELTEAEKKFDKQFGEWEAQFQKWKEQNANHPDKEQYREYEKKWEAWRSQLLDRREQMKRKRLGLVSGSPQPASDRPIQAKPENAQQKLPDLSQVDPQAGDNFTSVSSQYVNYKGRSEGAFDHPPGGNKSTSSQPPHVGPQILPSTNTGKPDVSPLPVGVGKSDPQMTPDAEGSSPGSGKPGHFGHPQSQNQRFGSKQPSVANTGPAGFSRPPPNQNNQPLDFKKSNSDFDEELPHKVPSAHDDDDGAASSFFKPAGAEGIPGLDLVKDGKDEEKTDEPFTDQKDSQKSENLKGPDLEAISRGINSILGDQKLMNMLSLVSQNQSRPTVSHTVNTISSIKLDSPKFSPEGYSQEISEHGDFSNQEGEFYEGRREMFSNLDEQTRSSFNAANEAEGLGRFDTERNNFNPDFSNSGRDCFDARSNEFNDDFHNERFRDSSGFDRGLNNWNRGSDDFDRGANFNRGPSNFNRGPNNFNRGPDSFNRGPDNFNRGSDNFNRDCDEFSRGDPDDFNRGPDNFSRGSNNFSRGPENFRGRGNFRGPDKFSRGPGDFNRSPDNFSGVPDNFNRGSDNFNRGFDSFSRDPDNFSRVPDNFNRGSDNFNRALDSFDKGSDSFGRGPDSFSRGPNDFNRGPDNFNRDRDSFSRGPGNLNRGPDNFNRGPNNFNRGSENFNRGSDNCNRGPDNFSRVTENFNRDLDTCNRGSDSFSRDPESFNRISDNFKRGPDNFSKGPDNFDRDADDFSQGLDRFNRGPNNFNRDSDNFNRGPSSSRGPDNFNRGSDNFGRGPSEFGWGPNRDNRGPGSFTRESDNLREPDEMSKVFSMRNNEELKKCGRESDNFNRGPNVPGGFGGEAKRAQELDNFKRLPQNLDQAKFNKGTDNLNKTIDTDGFQPKADWNRSNSFPNDPIPSLLSDLPEIKNDKPGQSEDIWKPTNVVDYDHKTLKPAERDVILEPSYSFDYRHKPLNRIPYPQRPKWLSEMVRSYPEFDVMIGRAFEPQQLRRYPVNELFDSRLPNDNYQKYDDRDRKPYDERNRKPYDDWDRKPYDDWERAPYDDRDRKPYEDHDRKPYEDRDRKPYEDRDRKPYEDRDRKPYEDRDRKLYEDRDRKPYEVRDRRPYEDHDLKPYEDHDLKPYEDRDRKLHDEPPHKADDKRSRDFGNRKPSDEPIFFSGKRPRFDDQHDNVDNDVTFKDKKQKEQNKGEDSKSGSDNKAVPSNMGNKVNVTLIEDLLSPPGRFSRPPRLVIILRGPPGSGKSFLAKLIKDKEVENGGSAPRILCLDDYFMVEQEKEVEEDGRKVKIKEMVYEYEECMESSYRQSLMKSFKKTITDGYFNFIIVDNINDKVKYFGEMWSFAKQNGFQVYICQLELDVQTCTKRNVHGRSEVEIERCVAGWEQTPSHHPVLDATNLIQSGSIPEVEMEEINSPASENLNEEEHLISSKWDNFDYSVDNLAKLDGTNKPLRPSRTMEDYLQLDDEWIQPASSKPGQKRVRWADLEERKKQEKMRAIGFVVGQTNWDRMMDPTMGSGALTQTKYIERYNKY